MKQQDSISSCCDDKKTALTAENGLSMRLLWSEWRTLTLSVIICLAFGKPIHPNQPYNYLKRFCEREMIEFKALHSFRHSLVTNMIHSNVDVTTISNIVGHIYGNVTLSVYAHEFKEATAFGCNVMSDLLNQQRNKCEKPA